MLTWHGRKGTASVPLWSGQAPAANSRGAVRRAPAAKVAGNIVHASRWTQFALPPPPPRRLMLSKLHRPADHLAPAATPRPAHLKHARTAADAQQRPSTPARSRQTDEACLTLVEVPDDATSQLASAARQPSSTVPLTLHQQAAKTRARRLARRTSFDPTLLI